MRDVRDISVITRSASIDTVDLDARTIDIVWTTGATVQRYRWDGWDSLVEYDEELIVDSASIRLERMNSGAPFLNSHNGYTLQSVLGNVVEGSVRIANGQGTAKVRLTSAPDAADIVHRILEKTVRFVSVGYNVHEYKITKRDGERELWQAVDWEPMEVSAVAMPADAGAVIRSEAKTNSCVLIRAAETAAPVAPTKGNDMTTPINAGGEPEIRTEPTIVQPTVDAAAIRAQANADAAAIFGLAQRHNLPSEIATDLIARGVTIDAARATILDHLATADDQGTRTASPTFAQANSGPSANDMAFRDGMTNAMLHRSQPGQNVLSDQGRDFRGLSLLEMARSALERNGISTRGMSKMELATAALMGRASVGYHTTSDFASILANVANKTLRAAYDGTPRTFTAWARQTSIPDFKQVQRTQLGGAPDLVRVPESGEFTYGTIGEGKEVYSLSTFGRIVAITRQTLVNDDLDAFARIPAAYGASAADLESDMVYALLSANAAMGDGVALFHATHANLGTAAVINEASLAEAYRLFANQRGIEGRHISIQPRYIITPPGGRSVEARKNVTATTPNAVSGVNAFAGRLEPIEEPRLIPAAGADPWYVIADPSRIDTVEYAYLEGQQGIYTETRQGYEVDGMEIKVRHDFATKAIDWRGMLKNAGL